ncbi:MAG TPA: type II CAAX endopeptidase family protein [Thermoanaerobaculia bacterium]|nr:type II CAAX endopeptidase family protein [Thermoanaerobaculia bacterium]
MLFLVVFVIAQVIATALLYLIALALGREKILQGGGMGELGEGFLLSFALTAPPLILMTWAFVRYLDRRDLASLGARWPAGGRSVALRQALTVPLATLGFLGLWLALAAAVSEVRFGGLSEEFQTGPSGWPGETGSVAFLALLLLGFLIQGGVEEWVVRGYIYRALKERWRWWVSALASSLLFSLMHIFNPDVSWVALVNIVLAGVILALLVERSGSLWGAVLAHGVWNFAVACLLSLPVSGIRMFRLLDLSIEGEGLLTGGKFGPEGSLLLTLLGLLLIAALWPRGRGAMNGAPARL